MTTLSVRGVGTSLGGARTSRSAGVRTASGISATSARVAMAVVSALIRTANQRTGAKWVYAANRVRNPS